MVLTIIIDILIVAMIGIGAFFGIKNGFIATLAKPVKLFASVLLAIALSSTVATTIVEPIIETPLTGQITEYLVTECENLTSENAKEQIPTVLKFASGVVGIDISEISGDTSAEYITDLVTQLAHPAIHIFAIIISFVILYFLLRLVFSILLSIVDSMFNKGFIGALNKIVGCVFTTSFAIIIAWAFVSIFDYSLNLSLLAENDWAVNFEGGYLYRLLKNISPIDLLLSF